MQSRPICKLVHVQETKRVLHMGPTDLGIIVV